MQSEDDDDFDAMCSLSEEDYALSYEEDSP